MTALALSRPDLEWQADAACRGADPALFFPDGQMGHWQTQEAKAICATCPVVEPCLAYATVTGAEGIWGGLTERERHSQRLAALR